MYLTKEQEAMLSGEKGETMAKCIQLTVKIGEIYDAKNLIPIKSAQIAGVSYYTVGDAIFSFFKLLSEGNVKVRVPSWLNPAGMDTEKWKEMCIDADFADKQFQIIQKYRSIGVETTLTCTPYLIGHKPSYGDHLAWSESSAVTMANSFFGARTNREGGPSSLAAAIVGYTANYGMHLTINRQPTILVNVKADITSLSDFSALGYWYGENYQSKIPYFTKISGLDVDHAKMLSSAMASSGSVPLFHIQGLTPEANNIDLAEVDEKVSFTNDDLKQIYEHFNQSIKNPELVAIGCPHASFDDIKTINKLLKNRNLLDEVEFWIFSSRKVANEEKAKSIVLNLESKGIRVYTDTCMVVSPAVRNRFNNILTNSAKAAFYLIKGEKTNVNFLSLEEIMELVTN
ncbi:MAG: aconitase X catalytic domain-containing protein [Candidatus Heimdallarchaeota archaeon]|nr:aconitase X catalytic domain-containing protein [Candidatus Heimdallarchaeota archaeon]MCK4953988.1 aconitase X catalytic domain-containing protein [Candidatus Heimdallarchaeota archaeon]